MLCAELYKFLYARLGFVDAFAPLPAMQAATVGSL